ncbi:hypothetical protein RFI_10195 [Reticulomyxa filosa]|uniref:Uncharacterized protein n=1 Tax=Reticulomyxa filosa TaxID=46433 RepID=X6NMN4_RETFI|nr:hypothetical protein RFI_10195 [Reticulomyxa filosa]|eukprot:ETO26939.1 hypothetical protein RFI_10195 [Reticulomyxa filosa]
MLESQLKHTDVRSCSFRLDELMDSQAIMSQSKHKAFFSVFVQLFCQTFVDVDLYSSHVHDLKEPTAINVLTAFDGIADVLNEIDIPSSLSSSYPLHDKVQKVLLFMNTLQSAITVQQNAFAARKLQNDANATVTVNTNADVHNQVDIECLIFVVSFVGRKLTCHPLIRQQIHQAQSSQVSQLALARCRDVFKTVITRPSIFPTPPRSITEVILQTFFFFFFFFAFKLSTCMNSLEQNPIVNTQDQIPNFCLILFALFLPASIIPFANPLPLPSHCVDSSPHLCVPTNLFYFLFFFLVLSLNHVSFFVSSFLYVDSCTQFFWKIV